VDRLQAPQAQRFLHSFSRTRLGVPPQDALIQQHDYLANEMRARGAQDILIVVVDGLKGFPKAITAMQPHT